MIVEALMDFVFPKICVGCGQAGVFLCSDCFERLDFADQICPMCGESSQMGWTHKECRKKYGMEGLIAIYEYQEPIIRAVIDGIKYGFNRDLIKIVLKNFIFETGEAFDYLVPVPLHYYRQNWRGFNQAEEIAKEVESKMKIPIANILLRIKNTKQQVSMRTKQERETNVKGVFKIMTEVRKQLKGKKILLIDDVFTSGADMRECTKVLKKAGVKTVWGLALAH